MKRTRPGQRGRRITGGQEAAYGSYMSMHLGLRLTYTDRKTWYKPLDLRVKAEPSRHGLRRPRDRRRGNANHHHPRRKLCMTRSVFVVAMLVVLAGCCRPS